MNEFRGVFTKLSWPRIYRVERNYFPIGNSLEYVHGFMDRVHAAGSWVHGPSLNEDHLSGDLRSRSKGRRGIFFDLIMATQARSDGGGFGSDRWRRGRALTVVRHGQAWRLTGVRVFSSHVGRFPMRFAPMGS
jgi:hypothetical protein